MKVVKTYIYGTENQSSFSYEINLKKRELFKWRNKKNFRR